MLCLYLPETLFICRSLTIIDSCFCLLFDFLVSFSGTSPPPLTVQQYSVICSSSLYGSHTYRTLDWFGISRAFLSFAWRISPSPVKVFTGLLWAVWHSLRCFLLFILPVDLLSHFDLPHCNSISESWNQWWEGENFGAVVQKWVYSVAEEVERMRVLLLNCSILFCVIMVMLCVFLCITEKSTKTANTQHPVRQQSWQEGWAIEAVYGSSYLWVKKH